MLVCRSCGQQNPDGFRFCGACGAGLAAAPPREVRKTVTVVFADVTGSTALGERLDPEAFRNVMARYFDAARACLERHGGTVEKFIGDAVMAVFGVPTMHEDDALRALRAAADLRDALAALNRDLDRYYGVSLQLRTGVNTGEVVTGTAERLATGDAVNVAARLEQAAQPGEILIGDRTRRLAEGAIEVEPIEPLTVKGKAEPLAAHRLLRVVEGAPAFERRLDAPLVGRRDELGRIRAAFAETAAGRCCRLVTVLGPPGIGKSRLAREAAAALAADAEVLVGRCLPYGDGITFWPFVEIFRDAGAEQELEQALAAGAAEEIFWALRKALETRARRRPLALVVEDIHWAEPTLLDLIEHLVNWTRDAPIVLLCLARPELLDRRQGWSGETIRLAPLSGGEADALMAELDQGVRIDAAARARIREVAGGNPLFLEQLLAMLVEGGDPAQVPPTMHALLAARLDGLPDAERDLLERASVIGLEFEWEALNELARDGARPSGAQLAALVRKELIRPHELLPDTFSFRHILIRDAAYERLPKELRADLHERVADWLDGRGEELEEIVGHHLEQAYSSLAALGPPGPRALALAERAAAHLAASGARAYVRSDIRAAAGLLQRALALIPRGDPRRLDSLSRLGRSLFDMGALVASEEALTEAVALARDTGRRGAELEAAVELASVRLNTSGAAEGQGDVWRALDAAIPFQEQAGDEAALARSLGLAGMLRFWRGEAAAALEDLTRAERLARNAGDRAEETNCLHYVLIAMELGPTPVTEALARIAELEPAAARNRLTKVQIRRIAAHLEAMRGQFALARQLIAEAKELVADLGVPNLLVRVALDSGPVELLAGDPVAAERDLRAAHDALLAVENWGHLASITPLLVDAVLAQGRADEALALTDVITGHIVPEDVDGQAGWRRTRARALAARGELAEAERLAREAVTIASGTDYLVMRAKATSDLAEVLHLAGRAEEAAAALGEAIRLHEQKGNVAAARDCHDLARWTTSAPPAAPG